MGITRETLERLIARSADIVDVREELRHVHAEHFTRLVAQHPRGTVVVVGDVALAIGGDDDVQSALLEPFDGAFAWFMSPLSGPLAKPRASSFSESSAVAVLVRTNTSIASNSSASRIRVRASSLWSPTTRQ